MEYRASFLTLDEEQELARRFSDLPFRAFQFHGFEGNRRTVSYGLHYAFDGSGLRPAEPIPAFLLPIRERAETFAGLASGALQHALIVEYAPGAGIGWHRDRPVFGDVLGISLLAEAKLRFRRRDGAKWQRTAITAEPRSAYLLRGPARDDWEHSITPMAELRYSITFRTLRGDRALPAMKERG